MNNKEWHTKIMGYLIPIVFTLILIVVVQVSTFAADGKGLFLIFLLGILAIAAFSGIYKSRRLPKLFQQPSPKKLLAYYDEIYQHNIGVPMVKDLNQVMRCTQQASILCYYGAYEEAEMCMQTIDYQKLPPCLQARQLHVNMLISCLRDHNLVTGGNLCVLAAHMNQEEERANRKKVAPCIKNLWFNISIALRGQSSEDTLEALEEALEKIKLKPELIMTQLLLSWILANVYAQKGEFKSAEEKLTFCKLKAPYCTPLHSLVNTL